MSPEHSGAPIDALQAELRQTLDTHLALLARQYEQGIEEARAAAAQEAEKTFASRLAGVEGEWTKRVESEVASARAEAERQLAAETTKVRTEAEQKAAESVALVRTELETVLATERQRAESLVQAERQRAEEELEAARTEARQTAERLDQVTRARTEAEQQARTHAEAHSAAEAELERHLQEQKQHQQKTPPPAAGISVLDGIRAIDGSRTLTEALEMVLRHTSSLAPRAVVFLINGPRLRSWKSVGFPQFDAQPFESAITGSGLLAQAIQSGEPTLSGASQPPPTFASLPGDLSALVVPVVLSGRAVALIYADTAGKNDIAPAWRDGVENLVRHASTHLALLTAMRTVQAMGATAPVGTGGAVRPESDTSDQSARRYARLLVSEIKLYNEAAVRAGREQRDLLRRLRPEIDRARRLYEERISGSVGGRGAYFQQELVQTLADGDPALLGNS